MQKLQCSPCTYCMTCNTCNACPIHKCAMCCMHCMRKCKSWGMCACVHAYTRVLRSYFCGVACLVVLLLVCPPRSLLSWRHELLKPGTAWTPKAGGGDGTLRRSHVSCHVFVICYPPEIYLHGPDLLTFACAPQFSMLRPNVYARSRIWTISERYGWLYAPTYVQLY